MGKSAANTGASRISPATDGNWLRRWSEQNWKKPLALAVAVHLGTVILSYVSPFFHLREPLPDVQTVNLFNAQEMPAPAPAPAPAPKPTPAPPVETPPPPVAQVPPTPPVKPVVSVAESKVVPPKDPGKIVSLEPVKEKKVVREEKKEVKIDTSRLDKALKQVETKASRIKAAEKAEKEAEKEVASALDQLRQSMHTPRPAPPSPKPAVTGVGPAGSTGTGTSARGTGVATGPAGATGGAESALVKQQYYASVIMHLSRFWSLPETEWSDNLMAIAIIWLEPNGKIIKTAFERQSENDLFNRFVSQTIEKANPLPPVPEDLQEEFKTKGIGIRFRPADFR